MEDLTGPESGYASEELPTPQVGVRRERADAARNRAKVLAAAERLFAEHGVEAVTMDDVATAAGVGKGTLYRRFGDRSGLAVALLDERERELQERVLRGPPPLGPGVAPAERAAAFVDAYVDLLDSHLDLILLSETSTPGARYRIGSYRFWHHHLRLLITEARPGDDADYLATALLAPLAADVHRAVRQQGVAPDRVRGGLRLLVCRVLGAGTAG